MFEVATAEVRADDRSMNSRNRTRFAVASLFAQLYGFTRIGSVVSVRRNGSWQI